jgi:hypothetical protein
MVAGMKDNVLAEVRGVRGALALITAYVHAATQQFVEGDVRVWADGSPTPAVWESGWEDFFNGAHGYGDDLHHCGEAAFAYDRVDPPGWPGHNAHQRVHFFQARALAADAVTFEHSVRVAVEGLPVKFAGDVRALVLFYGLPAPPLETTDWVRPADEWAPGGGGGGGTAAAARHGYTLTGVAPGTLAPYTLRSVVPSYGEESPITLLKCFRKVTELCLFEGARGGVVLTRPALALPPGARAAFTVALAPTAERVFLRRLVDARFSVQRAALFIDGVYVRDIASADRDFAHFHASWKVDTVALPPELTRGRSRVRVAIVVRPIEGAGNRSYADWSHLGDAWTEAQWEVVCVPPIRDL